MDIEKHTFGMGDRFAHQGHAQLQAVVPARETGLNIHPVWNKSNREHTIIHSEPDDVRAEADAATAALGWTGAYYVDADHIGLKTVDRFISASDFYTLDVADFTGQPASAEAIERFVVAMRPYAGSLTIPGLGSPLPLDEAAIDIAKDRLPSPKAVVDWTSEDYVGCLRHDRSNPAYNPDFRQLIHVGFKVAAGMGARYLQALEEHEKIISRNVTENLFARHIKPIFT